MSKSGDVVKREEWLRRLDRFESGDLSIAEFCRDEGVGTHTFHYWSKQLGRKSSRNGRSRAGKRGSTPRLKQRVAVEPAANEATATKPEVVSTSESVVHFTWDSRLSFSVPADCLDAIRCVLEYASHSRAGSQDAPPVVSAFRQVIVD